MEIEKRRRPESREPMGSMNPAGPAGSIRLDTDAGDTVKTPASLSSPSDGMDDPDDLSIDEILADVHARRELFDPENRFIPPAVFEDALRPSASAAAPASSGKTEPDGKRAASEEQETAAKKAETTDAAAGPQPASRPTAVIREPSPRRPAVPPAIKIESSPASGKSSAARGMPSAAGTPDPAGNRKNRKDKKTAEEKNRQTGKNNRNEKNNTDNINGANGRPGRRGLFGRRKYEREESLPIDDPYYGLKLKSIEEYRRQYQETMALSLIHIYTPQARARITKRAVQSRPAAFSFCGAPAFPALSALSVFPALSAPPAGRAVNRYTKATENAMGRNARSRLESPSSESSCQNLSLCPSSAPMEKTRNRVQPICRKEFALWNRAGRRHTHTYPIPIPKHITARISIRLPALSIQISPRMIQATTPRTA